MPKQEIKDIYQIGTFRFKSTYKIKVSENTNVLKTGPVIELEKFPVHGSLVGPVVEPLLNR